MTTPSPDQIQAQTLAYVRQGQEALTTMLSTLSETLASVVRSASGMGTDLPTGLPKPAEAIDQAFDVSIQVLEMQRAFAHSLLDSAAPALKAAESVVDSTVDRARTR